MRIELTPLMIGKTQELSFETTMEAGLGSLFEHLSPERIEPISVKGRVFSADKKLFVELSYKGCTQIHCDRCLKLFDRMFEGEVFTRLIQGEEPEEITEEETDVRYFLGDVLELDTMIQDDILLNLPLRLVCQPGCQGLCPTCGCDLNEGSCGCGQENVDPRLASLKDLLKHT